MSIYLDEKNPGKHKPFEDASPDIVEYVRRSHLSEKFPPAEKPRPNGSEIVDVNSFRWFPV